MTYTRSSRLIATAATAVVASVGTFATTSVVARDEATVKVCVGKRDTVVSAKPNGRCPKGARLVQINQTGATGAAGTNGADGQTGTNGRDGVDGKDAPVPVVALRGATAAAIGDSNTDRNGPWGYANRPYVPQLAWFHLASTRVGQRVRLTDNFAVSGSRSDEMVAKQLPKVLALTPQPSVVTVMSGTNDVSQGRTAADVIASLDATYTALTTRGIKIIAGTVLPSDRWSDPAKAEVVREVNEWIRSRPGVTVVDFNAVLSDANGNPKPGVLMDGTHISTLGAAQMGSALAPVLEQMFPAVDIFPAPGADLLTGQPVSPRADGVDVSVSEGFQAGDRVVALVRFATEAGADSSVRQIEATLSAVGTESAAGVFTDTPGYDGPEGPLTTVPRAGVMTSPVLTVPPGASALAVSVRVTGGTANVGRVSLVKVP